MNRKQKIGHKGESCACQYLCNIGYNIIQQNFKCNQGEIDIIAYDINTKEIVFIEVKTRTNFNYGIPSESVTRTKIKHIKKCINYYIHLNNLYENYIRIDVIEIVYYKNKYKVNHLKNVI